MYLMSLHRTLKKAYYAAAGAGFLALAVVIAAYISVPEAPPEVTPTVAEFLPIEVQSTAVIPQAPIGARTERSVDVVTRLRNPNLRAGVGNYRLKFTLLDTSGEQITSVTDSTYVLPGTIQYAAVLDIRFPADRRLGRVEVVPLEDPTFIRLPEVVELPRFNLFLQERSSRLAGEHMIDIQRGIVTNTSTLDWQRVEVTAVALDANNTIIAVGRTFVGKLLVGEQREFSVEWPKSATAISQVIALPSTNIFREDNTVEIIGDPGLLR